MKKTALGLAIVLLFAGYSLYIRHQQPVIAKPEPLLTNTSSTSDSGDTNGSSSSTSSPATTYKDGSYTGSVANAYYGNVQVAVTITGGKIANVKFLQYPNSHSTSVFINQQAMPFLIQEAIKSQSANVQIVSGATFTSQAFTQSLSSALTQA